MEYDNKMQYDNKNTTIIQKSVKTGIGFGSVLALVISFVTWKSIGWAIFHGILGWIYVIYYIFAYGWS